MSNEQAQDFRETEPGRYCESCDEQFAQSEMLCLTDRNEYFCPDCASVYKIIECENCAVVYDLNVWSHCPACLHENEVQGG